MLSCGCGRKLRCNLPVDDVEKVAPPPTMKEAARAAVVDISAAATAAVKERANRPLKDT